MIDNTKYYRLVTNKLYLLVIMLSFQFIITITNCFAQESEKLILRPEESIIKNGLLHWSSVIPNEQLVDYGINSRDEFAEIKIGNPFYIYTVPEDSIVQEKGNTKIKFEFKDEWFIPLIKDEQICCFLSLKKKNGKQEIVGIGANFLAKDLNNEQEFLSGEGDVNGILLIPSISAGFLIKGKKELHFYPLGVSKCKFKTDKNIYLSKKEVFDIAFSLINRN